MADSSPLADSGDSQDLDFGQTLRGFRPGQRLSSRYTLQRILGRGGMGVVWLARDEELTHEIALKFLPEEVVRDREAKEDLKRETRRALELTHPHIVRIYDFVQGEAWAGISMEYIDGDTLSGMKLTQPGRCFDVETLLPWLEQLGEALIYAHEVARVVHRDLKPANLMINQAGLLKIADFGIAASLIDSLSRASAQLTTISGSPPYMSPQQALGDRPSTVDDIYALGATLYDLLTGKPPFFRGPAYMILQQVREIVPPPMMERRAELENSGKPIPPEWEETIAACLSKDPASRPQSVREVMARLQAKQMRAAEPVVETQPEVAEVPIQTPAKVSSPQPVSETPPIATPRRKWGVAVAGALLVALAATFALHYRDRTSTGSTQTQVTPTGLSSTEPIPKTLLVPDQHRTIQAAIDAARAGDTVMVKPGIYQEAIIFKEGIRLVGTDRAACRLEPALGATQTLLAQNVRSGSIESLSFAGTGGTKNRIFGVGWELDPGKDGTLIKSVTPDGAAAKAGIVPGMRLLAIDGEKTLIWYTAAVLLARGATSRTVNVELEHQGNTLTRSLQTELIETASGWPDGLWLLNSSVTIRDCIIEDFAGSGIVVSGSESHPSLVSNQFKTNGQCGIFFGNGAAGRAEGNLCMSNAWAGIGVNHPGTAPIIINNRCSSNGGQGIYFAAGAKGTAEGNVCEGNEWDGIWIINPATAPTVQANQLTRNKRFGIAVGKLAEPKVPDGNIYANNTEGTIEYNLDVD